MRRVERRARWVGVGLAAVGLLLGGGVLPGSGSPAAAQSGGPTVVLSASTAEVGDTVAVSLDGWPAGPALVEVCGNQAQRGSVDCDIVGAAAVNVAADGRASAQFVVGTPPTACPCVIRVSSRAEAVARTSPIALTGLPAGGGVQVPAVEIAASRTLEVEDVQVVDDADPPALFGAAATRRLELRIRNTGSAPVEPRLSVSVGDGDAPRTVEVPDVPTIPPGEVASVRATFHLPAFTFGREAVVGRIDGGDAPVRFTTSASTIPWGLIVAGALAAYLVLLRAVVAVVLRLRRRSMATAVAVEPTGVRVTDASVGEAHTGPGGEAPVVGRWDLVGAATPEVVLAALLDAGASEDAVRAQLGSLPLTEWRLVVGRTANADGTTATTVALDPGPADGLRRLGSVRALLEAGQLTEGTFRLARRAFGFLADASPTGAIPAEPTTILATIAACAAADALSIDETVTAPVTLGGRASPSTITVELLRRHGIPWRATAEPVDPPDAAALAVVAATAAPSGEVGPAVTTAVGHGAPSVDRATSPGAARLLLGRTQEMASLDLPTLAWGFTPDDAPPRRDVPSTQRRPAAGA